MASYSAKTSNPRSSPSKNTNPKAIKIPRLSIASPKAIKSRSQMKFNDLPTDLLFLIFDRYVNVRDRLRCSKVCRHWRNLLTGIRRKPYLHQTLSIFDHTENTFSFRNSWQDIPIFIMSRNNEEFYQYILRIINILSVAHIYFGRNVEFKHSFVRRIQQIAPDMTIIQPQPNWGWVVKTKIPKLPSYEPSWDWTTLRRT